MAIGANSYGDTADIAKLTPRWASKLGTFDEGTSPTLATVERWVDQVSGILNGILADERFSVPVSQADAKLALDIFVNQEVAALVEGVHNSGRFGPTANQTGGRFKLVFDDVAEFIKSMAGGLEALGASRGDDQTNVGTVALTRADGFSDDLDAVESSRL